MYSVCARNTGKSGNQNRNMESHQNRFLWFRKVTVTQDIQVACLDKQKFINKATWEEKKCVQCSKRFDIFCCWYMLWITQIFITF